DAKTFEKGARRWPQAGIGLPTGGENGIWVLEVDTPKGHGVDGRAELVKLVIKNTQLPVTLTSQSPSGSTHYYFQHPGVKVFNSAGAIAPGVDVRGDGGMCVAPPSMRKDGEYVWINTAPIAQAPKWLMGLV